VHFIERGERSHARLSRVEGVVAAIVNRLE
jgi:hypothetical protein